MMHAAACPSQATQALCIADGSAVSQASRRNRDAWRHQPSPPGDFMAGTARCASRGCRQVFGLVDARGGTSDEERATREALRTWVPLVPRYSRLVPAISYLSPLPRTAPQCVSRLRFHLPLRGSAGMGSSIRTGFPFHPKAQADGTDSHNISGFQRMVNTTYPTRANRASAGTAPGNHGADRPLATARAGFADVGLQTSTQASNRRRGRVAVRRSRPRPTTDARDVSALSSSRSRTFRSVCIIPYRLPQLPFDPHALPGR